MTLVDKSRASTRLKFAKGASDATRPDNEGVADKIREIAKMRSQWLSQDENENGAFARARDFSALGVAFLYIRGTQTDKTHTGATREATTTVPGGLTFLPSRNFTFPSIIQLLSTIVEARGSGYRTLLRDIFLITAFDRPSFRDATPFAAPGDRTVLSLFFFLLSSPTKTDGYHCGAENHAAKSILRAISPVHRLPSWRCRLAARTSAFLVSREKHLRDVTRSIRAPTSDDGKSRPGWKAAISNVGVEFSKFHNLW